MIIFAYFGVFSVCCPVAVVLSHLQRFFHASSGNIALTDYAMEFRPCLGLTAKVFASSRRCLWDVALGFHGLCPRLFMSASSRRHVCWWGNANRLKDVNINSRGLLSLRKEW